VSGQIFLFLVLGLTVLTVGADILVRSSSRLAQSLGVPSVVVGLTVVAFGTSAPEAVVTAGSALAGETGIAVGNVVGSNIFNVLFILGLSALVTPLVVSHRLVRFDVPVMVGASLLVLAFALDGEITRGEGLLLLAGIATYTLFLVSRVPGHARRRQSEPSARSAWLDLALVLAGLALLVLGSRWLVGAAAGLAEALGVSDLVIGLTVVAAGTSLPELAASVTAAARGERDIAVGNIVGSNIFNLLFVLGLGSTLAPQGLPIAPVTLAFDLPVMIAVGAACAPLFFTGRLFDRREGGLFVAAWLVYMTVLIRTATTAGAVLTLRETLLFFVTPLLAATLLMATLRGTQARRDGPRPPASR
jgi:cation:H+ antiporter